MLVKRFKFGVGRLAEGQCTLNEVLQNEGVSEEYARFLRFLGEPVCMYGWSGYRGGLDTFDPTLKAIHCTLQDDQEMLFHVTEWLHSSHVDILVLD